jgi:flagellar assembly protein FliH
MSESAQQAAAAGSAALRRAQAQAWTPPQVQGPLVGRRRLEELGALEREAWEHGFEEGRRAGNAAARAEQLAAIDEQRAQTARLAAILQLLARPLAELDERMHQQLAALAGAVARQLVRRELRAQPEQIIAVIRETLGLLPANSQGARIALHPDDAALVRARLAEPHTERAWTLIEDPVISRGGCRVSSEHSLIDATVEARLGAAIAAALGDERVPAPGGGA